MCILFTQRPPTSLPQWKGALFVVLVAFLNAVVIIVVVVGVAVEVASMLYDILCAPYTGAYIHTHV